jgi:cleavage stimulation factor subunit 2
LFPAALRNQTSNNFTIPLLHHWNEFTLAIPLPTAHEASFTKHSKTSLPLRKYTNTPTSSQQALPARTRSVEAEAKLHAHYKEQSWHTAERRAEGWSSSATSHTVSTPQSRLLATATDKATTGVSEEQICEIFGRAGQVVNFRLVYDKETGRPKGFGFLEYTDVDAAAAAVRNLNEFELNGRTLRVDYSNDNDKGNRTGGPGDFDGGGRPPPPAHFGMNMTGQTNGAGSDVLPPLPSGVQLPAGLTAPDAISQTLSNIDPAQLLDILSQMKTLTQQDPARAIALLQQAPQLGYAIFQSLLSMRLVSTDVLASLIQQNGPPAPAQAPPSQPPPMPFQPPQGFPPQPSFGAPPPGYGAPPAQYAPTPPPQQQMYQAPPPQAAAPAAAAPQTQEQLMQTVLALTREQVMALDAGSRDQIIALRNSMGAPL